MCRCTHSRYSLLLSLALLLVAAPLAAQPPILRGVDLLQTSNAQPTFADFLSSPLPADFFCPGSAPFNGLVPLVGVPLVTSPPGLAANADTLLERLTDGVFVGGQASIIVQVRAMRLQGSLVVDCPDEGPVKFQVNACACGDQPRTKIVAKVDQPCGCGHFDGDLAIKVCVTFSRFDSTEVLGPVTQDVRLEVKDTPWCPRPGAGTDPIREAFKVDSNCDGEPDIKVPGTSNFFPGWDCGTLAGDCWSQYADLTHCHSSYGTAPHEHCVNPMCGKRQ